MTRTLHGADTRRLSDDAQAAAPDRAAPRPAQPEGGRVMRPSRERFARRVPRRSGAAGAPALPAAPAGPSPEGGPGGAPPAAGRAPAAALGRLDRRRVLALTAAAGAAALAGDGVAVAQAPPRPGRRLGAGAAFDPTQVALPQQFPGWSDGTGWELPEHFLTIGLGDVDGDGRAELIGRSKDGIETWRFDETNLWTKLGPTLCDLSDTAGWDQPQYYATIQLADIDGDGRPELLARGVAGLYVYTFNTSNPQTPAWAQSGQPLAYFSDANGWTAPKYY